MNVTITTYYLPGSYSLTLYPGKHKFECWGAPGGTGRSNGVLMYHGGYGAYVSGEITLKAKTTFYLFVGGRGANGSSTPNTNAAGGYNGGGNGGADTRDDEGSGGGGGATDIRLINGKFDDFDSLISRIMVAAGGSGSVYNSYGAPGGGLTGFIVTSYNSESYSKSTTTQTTGNSFGIGGNGRPHILTPSSGAGGGYYGGIARASNETHAFDSVSSSGSSYISGHFGCNAVNENGTHTGSSIHYSQLYFENTVMLTVNDMISSSSFSSQVGNYEDGLIRITSPTRLFIKCTITYTSLNLLSWVGFILATS